MLFRSREEFTPHSIVKDCTIRSSAQLVTGFFVCDLLTIESRSKPLFIVGTFIVKNLDIDSSAIKSGITWMSIYSPDAVSLLRNGKILRTSKPVSNPDCNGTFGGQPIWNYNNMSMIHQQDLSSCNVSSLRATAQPFTWTAMDPDCGINPDLNPPPTNTTCKKHPLNFLVMEHSRGGGP